MEFYGKVIAITPIEKIGEKQLDKLSVVLEEVTDKEWKASMAVDLFGEKVNLIDGVKVGDNITAYLNFRANESKKEAGKYFNSISAWRIDKEVEETGEKPF